MTLNFLHARSDEMLSSRGKPEAEGLSRDSATAIRCAHAQRIYSMTTLLIILLLLLLLGGGGFYFGGPAYGGGGIGVVLLVLLLLYLLGVFRTA